MKRAAANYTVRIGSQIIKLSQREAECLVQLSIGKSAKQVGKDLNISPRTVEIHLGNIRRKAQCRNRLELLSRLDTQDIKLLKFYLEI